VVDKDEAAEFILKSMALRFLLACYSGHYNAQLVEFGEEMVFRDKVSNVFDRTNHNINFLSFFDVNDSVSEPAVGYMPEDDLQRAKRAVLQGAAILHFKETNKLVEFWDNVNAHLAGIFATTENEDSRSGASSAVPEKALLGNNNSSLSARTSTADGADRVRDNSGIVEGRLGDIFNELRAHILEAIVREKRGVYNVRNLLALRSVLNAHTEADLPYGIGTHSAFGRQLDDIANLLAELLRLRSLLVPLKQKKYVRDAIKIRDLLQKRLDDRARLASRGEIKSLGSLASLEAFRYLTDYVLPVAERRAEEAIEEHDLHAYKAAVASISERYNSMKDFLLEKELGEYRERSEEILDRLHNMAYKEGLVKGNKRPPARTSTADNKQDGPGNAGFSIDFHIERMVRNVVDRLIEHTGDTSLRDRMVYIGTDRVLRVTSRNRIVYVDLSDGVNEIIKNALNEAPEGDITVRLIDTGVNEYILSIENEGGLRDSVLLDLEGELRSNADRRRLWRNKRYGTLIIQNYDNKRLLEKFPDIYENLTDKELAQAAVDELIKERGRSGILFVDGIGRYKSSQDSLGAPRPYMGMIIRDPTSIPHNKKGLTIALEGALALGGNVFIDDTNRDRTAVNILLKAEEVNKGIPAGARTSTADKSNLVAEIASKMEALDSELLYMLKDSSPDEEIAIREALISNAYDVDVQEQLDRLSELLPGASLGREIAIRGAFLAGQHKPIEQIFRLTEISNSQDIAHRHRISATIILLSKFHTRDIQLHYIGYLKLAFKITEPNLNIDDRIALLNGLFGVEDPALLMRYIQSYLCVESQRSISEQADAIDEAEIAIRTVLYDHFIGVQDGDKYESRLNAILKRSRRKQRIAILKLLLKKYSKDFDEARRSLPDFNIDNDDSGSSPFARTSTADGDGTGQSSDQGQAKDHEVARPSDAGEAGVPANQVAGQKERLLGYLAEVIDKHSELRQKVEALQEEIAALGADSPDKPEFIFKYWGALFGCIDKIEYFLRREKVEAVARMFIGRQLDQLSYRIGEASVTYSSAPRIDGVIIIMRDEKDRLVPVLTGALEGIEKVLALVKKIHPSGYEKLKAYIKTIELKNIGEGNTEGRIKATKPYIVQIQCPWDTSDVSLAGTLIHESAEIRQVIEDPFAVKLLNDTEAYPPSGCPPSPFVEERLTLKKLYLETLARLPEIPFYTKGATHHATLYHALKEEEDRIAAVEFLSHRELTLKEMGAMLAALDYSIKHRPDLFTEDGVELFKDLQSQHDMAAILDSTSNGGQSDSRREPPPDTRTPDARTTTAAEGIDDYTTPVDMVRGLGRSLQEELAGRLEGLRQLLGGLSPLPEGPLSDEARRRFTRMAAIASEIADERRTFSARLAEEEDNEPNKNKRTLLSVFNHTLQHYFNNSVSTLTSDPDTWLSKDALPQEVIVRMTKGLEDVSSLLKALSSIDSVLLSSDLDELYVPDVTPISQAEYFTTHMTSFAREEVKLNQEQAGEILTRGAEGLLELKEAEYIEMITDKEFQLTVDQAWTEKYPFQYDMVVKWWKELRKLLGEKHVREEITVNTSGKNGLINITCRKIGDRGEGAGQSCSLHVSGTDDIGPRLYTVLEMVYLGSLVPNMTGYGGLADYEDTIDSINELYYQLSGIEKYFDTTLDYTQDTIDKKLRQMRLYLEPIRRIDYKEELEPDMAKEALRAV